VPVFRPYSEEEKKIVAEKQRKIWASRTPEQIKEITDRAKAKRLETWRRKKEQKANGALVESNN
jgi:hypothetical protein